MSRGAQVKGKKGANIHLVTEVAIQLEKIYSPTYLLFASVRKLWVSLDSAEFSEFDRRRRIPVQADYARADNKEVERPPLQRVQLVVVNGSNLSPSLRHGENIAIFDPRELLSILVINVDAHYCIPHG